jgi:ubiquinone/menaquinone biosynthesis C-methylase UbiE
VRKDIAEYIVEWDTYWKNQSPRRRVIEWIRSHYFSRVFCKAASQNVRPGARILEAGCGSGTYIQHLAKYNFFTVGIDNSIASTHLASKKINRIVLANLFSIPFPNDAFEVVFNQGVMEHFSDGAFVQALREMSRVGRRVVVIVPSDRSLFQLIDPFGDDPNKRFFSRRLLESLMKEVLENVHIRYMAETGFLSIIGEGNSPQK